MQGINGFGSESFDFSVVVADLEDPATLHMDNSEGSQYYIIFYI